MKYRTFEELVVWKRSARLSSAIYKELAGLKDHGFRDQITRSGLSIPSNIAEGFERCSRKEFIKFLSYAKGSSGELRTQVYIGMDIGYLPKHHGKAWVDEASQVSRMLAGLIKSLRARIDH